jgi:ribosome-associated protein
MRRQKDISAKEKALIIAEAALDKKADKVVIVKMEKVATMCDFFVICSGNTERKIKAISDNISEKLRESNIKIWHREGYQDASWVLIDCYDVVVHIFRKDVREFYNLEHLWADAPKRYIQEKSVKKFREKTHLSN